MNDSPHPDIRVVPVRWECREVPSYLVEVAESPSFDCRCFPLRKEAAQTEQLVAAASRRPREGYRGPRHTYK